MKIGNVQEDEEIPSIGPIPPKIMPEGGINILIKHMMIAKTHGFTLRELLLETLFYPELSVGKVLQTGMWFSSKVRGGKEWDYKNRRDPKNNKIHKNWRDFGNFHYGAVGTAAGFNRQVLLRAAGLYQSVGENADPDSYGSPYAACLSSFKTNDTGCYYGDSPRDQGWIKNGILFAEKYGY